MPIFNNHVQQIFVNFLNKIAENDAKLFKEITHDKLETTSPEDIATFLN